MKESWRHLAGLLAAAQKLRSELTPGAVSQATIDSFDECSKNADVEYLSQDIPRAIDQTLEGVQRVARIVSAMKEFSHPGSQEKQAVDLNRAIETTITISHNEWKYVADVQTQLDPHLPLVPCLAGEINQVLLNWWSMPHTQLLMSPAKKQAASARSLSRHEGTEIGWKSEWLIRARGYQNTSEIKCSTRSSPPKKSARGPAKA
jgi:hypothetical protein